MCIDPDIVDLLLERDDIDVNAAHAIAFQEAARKGMLNAVETMLSKRGANIHIQGGEYGGVIQAAAIGGHAEMLELLLSPQWRGNVNAVSGEFGTPLAAAVAFGHFEATRVRWTLHFCLSLRWTGNEWRNPAREAAALQGACHTP